MRPRRHRAPARGPDREGPHSCLPQRTRCFAGPSGNGRNTPGVGGSTTVWHGLRSPTYWLGGAELFVRKGNVTIEITWTAADAYRTRGGLVQGTNLPYGTAKRQATEIAERILAILK
ncbi:hypothetical protein GCM10010182_47250 [Actinomadura cremea]|nr:hypothetical protein GCM10010182_47250 [Actinomadura cremea]